MAYKTGFSFAYTTTGGPPVIKNLELTTGTSYHAGAVLRINGTTGQGVRVVTRATSVAGILACDVAAANATTPNKFPVYLPEGNVFSVKMPASIAPATVLGKALPLTLGTIHNYRVGGTAGTLANNTMQVVGFPGTEAAAAHTGGEYYVKFARSIFAPTKSSTAA